MEKDKKQEILFSEFPPVSTAQWEEKIQQDLKGADYDKKLVWRTAEGFKVKPYYRAEDLDGIKEMASSLPGKFPFLRGTESKTNNWTVSQDIESADPDVANRSAHIAVSRGATALMLNAASLATGKDLAAMLNGLDLNAVTINFNSSPDYPGLLNLLKDYISANGFDPLKVKLTFDFDPLSFVLLNGNFYRSQEDDMAEGAELLEGGREYAGFRPVSINGHYFHNAGSTLVQELAFALASGNEYLSYYVSKGFRVDEVTDRMVFVFATGGNYFLEIAKLRAARYLWARIVEQYKPESDKAAAMYIHSISANWNKTIYDPYVNMLRSTTEAMSAAIGHADMITVLPFDMNFREPDEFSMRIARNQQIILKEESNLDKVVDPAAGSYYIENITASMVDAAWSLFLKTEEAGGMAEAIKKGFVQDEIAASARIKKEDVAYRRTLVLGTNQHPNLNEKMLDRIQEEQEDQEEDETIETPSSRMSSNQPVYKTLEIMRAADGFEDLRLANEIWETEGNKRPAVFLLSIGNPAMRKARAGFSSAFFGCAGFEVIDNAGFASHEEAVKAAAESKAEIVVICSSDEEYAEYGATIAGALKKQAPDTIVVVAGYPKDITDQLKAAGVDEFIHVKSNALETLYAFQQKLGIIL